MKKTILATMALVLSSQAYGQKSRELKYFLNDEKTEYVKATFVAQNWARHTQNNPYSTVDGYAQRNTTDFGLRRTRIQFFGQLSPRVFFYSQLGMNNFAYNSTRKAGFFFHDVVTEYAVDKKLSIGTGLTSWTGLARYAGPGVGTILCMDVPLYQQFTADQTDQFLRKLSVYAKGSVGKINYRLIVSKPMSFRNSPSYKSISPDNFNFSEKDVQMQYHGYASWQFFEKESNDTPFTTGTYLGKKKVLNLGAGFFNQQNAMWKLAPANSKDTLYASLQALNADVFCDLPLNKEKGTALTVYGSLMRTLWGDGYIRSLGVMNPANGLSQPSFAGSGNNFAAFGTGNIGHIQAGFLLPKNLLGSAGTLQPYAAITSFGFDALPKAGNMWEAGINWLVSGHSSKITLNYQSRPVFGKGPVDSIVQTDRKGMWVLQYQIAVL